MVPEIKVFHIIFVNCPDPTCERNIRLVVSWGHLFGGISVTWEINIRLLQLLCHFPSKVRGTTNEVQNILRIRSLFWRKVSDEHCQLVAAGSK